MVWYARYGSGKLLAKLVRHFACRISTSVTGKSAVSAVSLSMSVFPVS